MCKVIRRDSSDSVLATLPVASDSFPEPYNLPCCIPYKGWFVWSWSGWKVVGEDRIVGDWCAAKRVAAPNKWRLLYAFAGGPEAGEYDIGDIFERTGSLPKNATERIKQNECVAGLQRLFLLIDEVEAFIGTDFRATNGYTSFRRDCL